MRLRLTLGEAGGEEGFAVWPACERKEEDGGSEWRQSMHNVCAFAIRYKVSIQS